MALRLVEAFVPQEHRDETLALLSEAAPPEHVWAESVSPAVVIVRAVVGSSRTGALIDQLHERFSSQPGFRVLVVSIDAVLPRPLAAGEEQERAQRGSSAAVSREEVYAKVADGAARDRLRRHHAQPAQQHAARRMQFTDHSGDLGGPDIDTQNNPLTGHFLHVFRKTPDRNRLRSTAIRRTN